jgi:molybdopterin synthase sulfur carrier subunit
MKILYFAWVRARVGVAEESVAPPTGVATVGQLIEWLKTRSPGHAEALQNAALVRVAVNQDFAKPDHPVRAGDEIAIFPPVTGG